MKVLQGLAIYGQKKYLNQWPISNKERFHEIEYSHLLSFARYWEIGLSSGISLLSHPCNGGLESLGNLTHMCHQLYLFLTLFSFPKKNQMLKQETPPNIYAHCFKWWFNFIYLWHFQYNLTTATHEISLLGIVFWAFSCEDFAKVGVWLCRTLEESP